ncbi:hypothetical protein GCM10011583_69920 [Streptomyces camponoticapitis]|uniref:Uncharacterized protein n=1 Tax=Streptomyces camponoticapitis TaxID=1616125 RepID=A0ABQ2EY55_9ACTN|nr:hypothetical protein GCM10011583_69920 [Streptomyces camponoticapitis]
MLASSRPFGLNADRLTGVPPKGLVAATVGDPAGFLHNDVDRFAGAVAFVASDHGAGGPVEPGEAVQAVAGQDAVDGGGGQAQDRADPGGPELAGPPQLADLFFDGGGGAPSARHRRTHL